MITFYIVGAILTFLFLMYGKKKQKDKILFGKPRLTDNNISVMSAALWSLVWPLAWLIIIVGIVVIAVLDMAID